MSKKIHIGTSGWSYNHWKGSFYPEKTSGNRMLPFYANHFSTVEINATFYRLPSIKTLEKWYRAVPEDFVFSVKASQYITHRKKLNVPKESIKKFFDHIPSLKNKLGPILFQLPPNWHKNILRLADFNAALPDNYRYVFEFRDPDWFADDIVDLLNENNIAFCIYDLEGNEIPLHITANFAYVRLHGPGPKYQGNYSKELLEKWADRFQEWMEEDLEIYCYFNNDYGGHAPKNATLLEEIMRVPS